MQEGGDVKASCHGGSPCRRVVDGGWIGLNRLANILLQELHEKYNKWGKDGY